MLGRFISYSFRSDDASHGAECTTQACALPPHSPRQLAGPGWVSSWLRCLISQCCSLEFSSHLPQDEKLSPDHLQKHFALPPAGLGPLRPPRPPTAPPQPPQAALPAAPLRAPSSRQRPSGRGSAGGTAEAWPCHWLGERPADHVTPPPPLRAPYSRRAGGLKGGWLGARASGR